MKLYHTGYQEIRIPDLTVGRKNADFGQGFYLTPDRAFAERWAQESRNALPRVNHYSFFLEGLRVQHFTRDSDWFGYIRANRADHPDRLADRDVIIGPIANDTLYDTLGIMTSGLLTDEQSLTLLRLGPAYTQIVLKTPRAAARLRWLCARPLETEKTISCRETLRQEELRYQEAIAQKMEALLED